MQKAITDKQKKMIWALANQKGMTSEDVYAVIYEVSGKEHMTQMTKEEAVRCIDRIHLKTPTPQGMITASQEAYIKDLARQLGWHTNPKRLLGFIRKYAKVDDISWLKIKDASNVIEGLKRQVKASEKVSDVK